MPNKKAKSNKSRKRAQTADYKKLRSEARRYIRDNRSRVEDLNKQAAELGVVLYDFNRKYGLLSRYSQLKGWIKTSESRIKREKDRLLKKQSKISMRD